MYEPERDLNLHGKAWLALGIGPQRAEPPFHRPVKRLAQMRLALITTGGFVPPGGKPFHTGKRGDPSFRGIDRAVDADQLGIYHPHYDQEPVRRDLNVLFPLPLCRELVAEKTIGDLAQINFSFMGYVPLTRKLEEEYAPQVAHRLKQQQVDAVLLTPA